jgi:hypothetical protein
VDSNAWLSNWKWVRRRNGPPDFSGKKSFVEGESDGSKSSDRFRRQAWAALRSAWVNFLIEYSCQLSAVIHNYDWVDKFAIMPPASQAVCM